MADIENIKDIIRKTFSKYTFHEDSHTYTYLDANNVEQTIGTSTTQLIHSYSNPFDEDKMSELVARKRHISQEEVLEEWNFNRELSCEYGTLAHLYLECSWNGWPFLYDTRPFVAKFGYDPVTPKFEAIKPALDKFYGTFKDRLEIIGAEVVIASENYDVAGSIDLLAYSKKLNAIVIIDNKSNKKITAQSYNDQRMLEPLDNLPDSNFWHYSLQGAIYKQILEYETGIQVSEQKFLIWFDPDNLDFKVIPCANLDKEALMILEKRKNERQKERKN